MTMPLSIGQSLQNRVKVRSYLVAALITVLASPASAQTIEDSANCTEVINGMMNLPGKAAIKRAEEIGAYGARIVHILNRYHVLLKGEPEVMRDDPSDVRDKIGMHCQAHSNETMLDAALGVYTDAELFRDTFGNR
jgi:hypothetical protein